MREVETFCHHLCAEEDVGFVFAELSQYPVMCSLARGGVEIHSDNARLGEEPAQFLFNALRADTVHLQITAAAGRANGVQGAHQSAVVTPEVPLRQVIGERHVAVAAHFGVAAVWTLYKRSEP